MTGSWPSRDLHELYRRANGLTRWVYRRALDRDSMPSCFEGGGDGERFGDPG